ncbi:MAG: sigma-70 family RNA polymerase sigma factor [Byssovorax sp.]
MPQRDKSLVPLPPVETGAPAPAGGSAPGVKVIVRHPRPVAPRAAPPAPLSRTRVVIRPPATSPPTTDRLLDDLCREHGERVLALLLGRGDLLPESTKDLAQETLLALCIQIRDKSMPDNVQAFLAGVVKNQARMHKRDFRPPIHPGADAEAHAASAPDPEARAEEAELRGKLDRYAEELTQEEAKVVRHFFALGLSVSETARVLGVPRGTVATQLARARAKLEEQAEESDRRVEARRR